MGYGTVAWWSAAARRRRLLELPDSASATVLYNFPLSASASVVRHRTRLAMTGEAEMELEEKEGHFIAYGGHVHNWAFVTICLYLAHLLALGVFSYVKNAFATSQTGDSTGAYFLAGRSFGAPCWPAFHKRTAHPSGASYVHAL